MGVRIDGVEIEYGGECGLGKINAGLIAGYAI